MVTERELDGQPGEEQVHDAVRDQARTDEVVEGVALLDLLALLRGLAADLAGVGHDVTSPSSSSLNQDSVT